MRYKISLFIMTMLCATNIFANALPENNQWNLQVGATNYADYKLSGNKAKSKITPQVAYGLNDCLSLNFKFLKYKDNLDDPNETVSYQLGSNYIVYSQDRFQLVANGGVRFIETEVDDEDGSGTSVYLGGKVYSTFNNYITGYVGLEYFTDPSKDIDYNDNLLEKVGLIVTVADNLDINTDYELSNKAFTYSLSYFFTL
jgi:hypothetical protein